MPFSHSRSNADVSKHSISKGSSRPSSGVGVLLLDVIGNEVKSHSKKDAMSSQSAKLNPIDIIKALNPSFRPPSAPIAPPILSLGAAVDAPNKRSKSASALPALPRKSRPSSRSSYHSSASAFIDDDASGEGLSIYGYVGTATATPRSELSFSSRATSAVSRSVTSMQKSHFTPFHTSRDIHLDDMIDDSAIDSFLIDFKRKSRMPFAAARIQSWWRMARQRRAFNTYHSGRKHSCLRFKHRVFKAWHGTTVAQSLCRALYLNISFRYWIKVVMDSRGWVNFCAEACNILSQRPTGLPGPVLWNICIRPSTWIAAQDEERTLGDPLPVRALVVALQSLRSYSSKCISSTFRRWMKAFRWGVDQRAKGRLKLGLVLRTRFKEKFRLKFQMWARWAFFTRARRLHTPLPVFTDHLPFWTSWIAKKMRKLMYVVPADKSFWFRWMFFKLKKVCQAKVSKSSKISLVDQVFCVSRMKNALNAWAKGMIVIRSETAFLLSRWRLFCLAIRMRKMRHKMKREVLRANCVAVTKRGFTKWANIVKNALSYVVTANNSHKMNGSLSLLFLAFYIWTEQRAHAILVSVFMTWSQRARKRITWAIFLQMHSALSQRKLMRSVFAAWRQPAQASFLPMADAEIVAMYILSHRHDSQRINITHGNRAFKAVSQQISDVRNITFARANEAMQTCPFESADKLCIQLSSSSWLQQMKSIISVKPSGSICHLSSSKVPFRNLNDVFVACEDVLDPSFVSRVLLQPRQTFSKAKDVSECNWGKCVLSAASRKSEYAQSAAALAWADLVYLTSVTSNSCLHENSLRQHLTKVEMAAAVKESSEKMIFKSKHCGEDVVSRCLQLTGMRMWLSSVAGGWNTMSALVPLTRNISAIWDLRLKERRALILRDNLIIISGKVKDESSIFAALFKTKKAKKKVMKKKRGKKKNSDKLSTSGAASDNDSIGTAGSPSPVSKNSGFPQFQASDSVIKMPDQNMTMIQRLTNMVHSSDEQISSFTLSETVSEAMEPDSELFDQQLHNRYVAIANDFDVSNAALQLQYSSDSDDDTPVLQGFDSDEEEVFAKAPTAHAPLQAISQMINVDLAPEEEGSEKTAITLVASAGPDFHVSLAMKQFIAPKPIRVPRVPLPVSLLAIARDLALQLSDKYDSAQADLHSQILEAVAHKPAHPQSDESSEVDDDLEENVDPLVSSPTASAVNQDPGTHFVISSANEMVVCSDLAGVTVKSQSLNTPNILFDMEGDLDISKDDLKYLNGSNLTAPELGTSFSALEAKFVNPFSPQAKGKPFQHWDAHDEAGGLKPDDTMPVLLAIPQAKGSKQPKTQKLKPDTAVSHSAASPSSLTVVSSPAALHNIPHAVQELDFSLPDVPDVVKDRQSHSNALGAFPPATSPSKQNRYKAPPDRVRELLDTVNPPSAKDVQLQSESQPTIAEAPSDSVDSKSSEDVAKLRKQFSEMGQKNAQKLKHSHSESANAAKALTQSEEASNRRKLLLHEATESAYDALDLMAPHLKAIFEENFDSLINRVIDANAKNYGSTDRHIWHELNLQRNAELQDASKGSLVADSDDHIKRVFQSRQNYRAMMAKSESFQGRAEGEPNHGQESLLKSRPSVELDRELQSNVKASKSTMNTFSSGNRDFVTGLAKSVSTAALKAPFLSSPQPHLSNQAETDFAHVSQMQLSRSFNKAHVGRGTVEPFSAPQTFNVHSTPRENSLVPAPQFVIIDSSKLAPAQQLEITGSEIPEMSNSDSAEAAFLKAKNTRLALSKPGTSNPAFKTQSDRILKPAVQSVGLPIVGGTSLGISVSKNQSLPRLESTIASIGLASEKSAAPTSATVSEQAAISNVQGLICAKSIFKAAPQSVPRKPPRAQFSASSSDRFAGTRDLQTATSQNISDANITDSAVVLSPKALNSTQILGLYDIQPASLFDEADSEVDRYLSTAPSLSVLGGLSPSMSPHPSSPPIVMAHFTASQAATDFNQFLDSLSIDDALNKSLASNAAKPTQSRHVAHADAEHSSRHAQRAEQVTAAVAPPRGDKSYDIDSAPPSSGVVADLQGFRHEAPAKKPFEAAQASGAFAANRVHATGVTATSATVPAVAHQTSVTPSISAASVRALPADRHAVSTSVSILMPSVDRLSPVSDNVVKSSGVAAPPSATATLAVLPSVSHQLAADFIQDSAVSLPLPLASKEHVAASYASQDAAGAEDALKSSATFESVADPVFEFHASAAPLNNLTTSDAPGSSLSTSPLNDLNDVSLPTSQPPSAAISATPQVPHTTPHASQVAPVSQPIKSSPLIAQKPGVQGSAIRSFLLNIQGKAASDSVSGNMSPREIIYQQRASAVELIRQRSMMNPDSRRKPSGIAAEHPVSSTSRRQTLDRVDGSDDSSDEELRAGYIFKNQKIKSLQAHMSSLSREFNALRSMYPPNEEIGERGDIVAGVDHFHDKSSRITDRSADNSSITNRLSAFISDLGRSSPARGALFSFDSESATSHEEPMAKIASRATVRAIVSEQKTATKKASTRAAEEEQPEGSAASKREPVTMRLLKTKPLDASVAAAALKTPM